MKPLFLCRVRDIPFLKDAFPSPQEHHLALAVGWVPTELAPGLLLEQGSTLIEQREIYQVFWGRPPYSLFLALTQNKIKH